MTQEPKPNGNEEPPPPPDLLWALKPKPVDYEYVIDSEVTNEIDETGGRAISRQRGRWVQRP